MYKEIVRSKKCHVRTLNNKGGKLMPPYVAIFCHLEDTDTKNCASHNIVVDRKFSYLFVH